MQYERSPLDTPESTALSAITFVNVFSDKVTSTEGADFVREFQEQISKRVSRCYKEALLLFGSEDGGMRPFTLRYELWLARLKILAECVKEIDEGRPFNPVTAISTMAYLEGEVSGFVQTLVFLKQSSEA